MRHTYTVEDGPKQVRETLSVAQNAIGWQAQQVGQEEKGRRHMARLQRLINECERKRPTGPDGAHDDRHTPECGCEDPPMEYAVRASMPGKEDLILACPSRGQAAMVASRINQDKTPATATLVTRPATGWSPL